MKWSMKNPAPGDMIRVKVGQIYHYGIYASDSEIIQFGLPPVSRGNLLAEDIRVCASDIETFLAGGYLETGELGFFEKRKARDPETVLREARQSLGNGGYHLLTNNCEHFVYQCVFGEKKSSQIDDVREEMSKLSHVDVYIASLETLDDYRKNNDVAEEFLISDFGRLSEVEKITNPDVQKEKVYAWWLLRYALKDSFGVRIEDSGIHKDENGKWHCRKCELSVTHKKEYVAVAVSKVPVGIDLEYNPVYNERVFQRSLHPNEKHLAGNASSFALLWTQKESIFKKNGGKRFVPAETDTTKENVRSFAWPYGKNGFFSVCGMFLDKVTFHEIHCTENGIVSPNMNLKEIGG